MIKRLFFILLFLSTNAFAQEFGSCDGTEDCNVYVDKGEADCTIGSPAVGTQADPYCTLNDALVTVPATHSDISGWTSGADLIFNCKSSNDAADTAAVDVTGYTTDSDNHIIIQTATSGAWQDRNTTGIYSSSYYRLELTATGDGLTGFDIGENYVDIFGLQVQCTNNDYDNYQCVYFTGITGAGIGTVAYSIIKGVITTTGADDATGLRWNDADWTSSVYNTIVYDFDTSLSEAIQVANATTVNLYNVTAADSDTGFDRVSGTMNVYNCLAYNNATDDWSGTIGGDYNATTENNTGSPGTNDVYPVSTTDGVDLNSPSTNDYSIPDTDSILDNVGTDNPGSGLYSDDIINYTRTSTWDIGAFELQSGATTTTTTTSTTTTTLPTTTTTTTLPVTTTTTTSTTTTTLATTTTTLPVTTTTTTLAPTTTTTTTTTTSTTTTTLPVTTTTSTTTTTTTTTSTTTTTLAPTTTTTTTSTTTTTTTTTLPAGATRYNRYGNHLPYGSKSIHGVPSGTVAQMNTLTGMEQGWRYDVTDGNGITDCVSGGGTDAVECCYDSSLASWQLCHAGDNPEVKNVIFPTIGSLAGKGLALGSNGRSLDTNSNLTDNTSYWLCTSNDCSTTCQVTIENGLITGCP